MNKKYKNVVVLLIDSLSAYEMKDEQYGDTSMPFLKGLRGRSVWFDKYYAGGPHTSLGLKNMFCGQYSLQDNGYLHYFSDTKRILFDDFCENGYEIYYANDTGRYLPKRFDNKVHRIYTSIVDFRRVIAYEFNYYLMLYKRNSLNDADYADLVDIYGDLFRGYLNFFKHRDDHFTHRLLENRLLKTDFEKVYKNYYNEFIKFSDNPILYINNDFARGECAKELSDIDINLDAELAKHLPALDELQKEHARFINELKRMHFLSSTFDPRVDYCKLSIETMKRIMGNKCMYPGAFRTRVTENKSYNLIDGHLSSNEEISFKSVLKELKKIIQEHTSSSDKPYFTYFHTHNQHYKPIEWFAFDQGKDSLESDVREAQELISNTHDYHGNIAYRLGMKYVDNCLKDFFEDKEVKDLLKNTIFVITADHGTSMGAAPIRDMTAYNNCHSELYHIPLVIIDQDREPCIIENFFEQKNFASLLLAYCGIQSTEVSADDVIKDKTSSYAYSERAGYGCASINHQDLYYTIRNDNFLVEYKAHINSNFDEGELFEVYNMSEDPLELHNLKHKISMNDRKVQEMIQMLKSRHEELQQNYSEYLNDRFHD